MAFTDVNPPDYETPLGQVRALIGDFTQRKDPANKAADAEYLFNDAQISAYLGINKGNVHFAAAHALDVLASNEALVSKKIRTEAGLQTDGPAVANALGEIAKRLRADGNKAATEADADGSFEIVDYQRPPDFFNYRGGW